MDELEQRRRRAEARRDRVTVTMGRGDDLPPRGATPSERLAGIWSVTVDAWLLSGRPIVAWTRAEAPVTILRPGKAD